jgi:ribosomal protein S18 acetylase RimI-like enzyme
VILRDWREADPGLLRACYDTEARGWRLDLAWETAWTWSTVEQARVTRRLPGLLALDERGRLLGWTFYTRAGRAWHIGGLVASRADATAALVDGILDGIGPGTGDPAACFIRHQAPGLRETLIARGFEVERFLYLSRPIAIAGGGLPPEGVPSSAPWRDADLTGAASLLQRAYGAASGRHFAPGGSIEEWTGYVTGLVDQRGCGVLDRAATRVVRDGAGVQALALVTSLAPQTAHLAQLAVRPDCRGRGIASALVGDVAADAARRGKTTMTLIVGEPNAAARRLYASRGFVERGTFIAATCDRRSPATAVFTRLEQRECR